MTLSEAGRSLGCKTSKSVFIFRFVRSRVLGEWKNSQDWSLGGFEFREIVWDVRTHLGGETAREKRETSKLVKFSNRNRIELRRLNEYSEMDKGERREKNIPSNNVLSVWWVTLVEVWSGGMSVEVHQKRSRMDSFAFQSLSCVANPRIDNFFFRVDFARLDD